MEGGGRGIFLGIIPTLALRDCAKQRVKLPRIRTIYLQDVEVTLICMVKSAVMKSLIKYFCSPNLTSPLLTLKFLPQHFAGDPI